MKACSVCGMYKPYEEFYRRPKSKDGYHGWCKVCKREYERSRNISPVQGGSKRCTMCWERKCIKEFRLNSAFKDGRMYWCKVCADLFARHYRQDPLVKFKIREWNKQRKEYYATGDLLVEEWLNICEAANYRCLACGKSEVTMDHIVPISKGGLHTKDNVQPLCRSCNSSKGVRTIDYQS